MEQQNQNLDLVIPNVIDPTLITEALKYGKRNRVPHKTVADALGITTNALRDLRLARTKAISLDTIRTVEQLTGFTILSKKLRDFFLEQNQQIQD